MRSSGTIKFAVLEHHGIFFHHRDMLQISRNALAAQEKAAVPQQLLHRLGKGGADLDGLHRPAAGQMIGNAAALQLRVEDAVQGQPHAAFSCPDDDARFFLLGNRAQHLVQRGEKRIPLYRLEQIIKWPRLEGVDGVFLAGCEIDDLSVTSLSYLCIL